MFHLLKLLSIIALIDYMIYIYYKKKYNQHINSDTYKYRIIICYIFWFIISFCITYNLLEFANTHFIVSILSLLLFLILNIYNKCRIKNYSIQFMCTDIVFGIILSNLLILLLFFIK